MLDPQKDIKIEHRVQVDKAREFKLIGRQRKQKGQKLFGYNPDTQKVYEVEIQKKEYIDITGKQKGSHKAVVNPNHPMLWAINYNNAIRKFQNGGLNVVV